MTAYRLQGFKHPQTFHIVSSVSNHAVTAYNAYVKDKKKKKALYVVTDELFEQIRKELHIPPLQKDVQFYYENSNREVFSVTTRAHSELLERDPSTITYLDEVNVGE